MAEAYLHLRPPRVADAKRVLNDAGDLSKSPALEARARVLQEQIRALEKPATAKGGAPSRALAPEAKGPHEAAGTARE